MILTRRTTLALLLAAIGAPAAAKAPVFSRNGAAINGYDPVAYFDQSAPVKGLAENAADWNGATWLFSSAQNKDRFVADPQAFAPQYGGYCAYAVAKGSTAKTEPEAWTVFEGKLYLNYSLGVRKIWRKDIPGYIAKADANWPGVLS
jgi:YHS domain-containing protein